MPSLQLHQYRVAAVSKALCIRHKVEEDTKNIIVACLLHDMGNIIKFKLELFPDFLEPEGLDYWQKVKQDFHTRYGNDEHEATIMITKEIFDSEYPGYEIPGQAWNDRLKPERVIELIDAIGFSNAKYNFECNDIARKIAAYSDMRVEPYGVTSLEHRLEDGHKRFKLHKPHVETEDFFNEMAKYLKKIEQQLFSSIGIGPSDITENSVQVYIPSLRSFEL